jgi:stage V sporulation protein SpoVS
MAFSPARNAFEGFRVLGRHPTAFLAWLAVLVVFWSVIGGVAWLLIGRDILAAMPSSTTPPDQVLAAFAAIMPKVLAVEIVVMAAGALLYAVILNAVARAVLAPEESRLSYLRLGGEEWRSALAYLAFYGLSFVLIGVAAGLVWGLYAATGAPAVAVLAGLLAFFIVLPVWIWGAVRLSLVLPRVVATGRLDFAGGWRLTRGRFWGLFGMAALIVLVVYAMQIVVQVVLGPIMTPVMMAISPAADPAAMMAALAGRWPMLAGIGLLILVSSMVQMVVQYAPFAAAYRDLAVESGDPEAFPASEFT